jgi:hypothetical protein
MVGTGRSGRTTTVILHFNYEEIQALRAGARAYLGQVTAARVIVLAPSESRERVEALLPRLVGDLSLSTLAEVRFLESAVSTVVQSLRVQMESMVLAAHAADEDAISAYFDFAHALTVQSRIREMAEEMEDMVELVTGEAPSAETARTFKFPD